MPTYCAAVSPELHKINPNENLESFDFLKLKVGTLFTPALKNDHINF